MKNNKIMALLLAAVIGVSMVGCQKKDDTSSGNGVNAPVADSGKETEEKKTEIKTLKSKEEVKEFSKETILKVEEAFKKNNVPYIISSDYLHLYYKGNYEKLGKKYDVKFRVKFDSFFQDTDERSIIFEYRIPLSDNAEILKLNLPELNTMMDVMRLNNEIKDKYSQEELLNRLADEFEGKASGDRVFSFSKSNLKDEEGCTILEGFVVLNSAIVEGNLVKPGVEYEFSKWDDYSKFPEKANLEIFNKMKTIGLMSNDADFDTSRFKDSPVVGYPGAVEEYKKESYVAGAISHSNDDEFNIEYILEGRYVPYDENSNKIKDTKYIDALIDTLNSSDLFKNKFSKEELMNEIYIRSQIAAAGADVYAQNIIDGVEKIEVALNGDKTQIGFKVIFKSAAVVEGQKKR